MTLLNHKKKMKKKYNFVIYFKDVEVINTSSKITFNQLINIIGLSLENKKIEYTLLEYLVIIEIKG